MSEYGARFATEVRGPSAAYGAWVERRIAGYLLQQQENHRLGIETRSRDIADEDPKNKKTVQNLKQSTTEANMCGAIELDLKLHKECVEAARRGWLCKKESDDFFVWISGKPFPQEQLVSDGEAGLARQPHLEIWEDGPPPARRSCRGISGNYMKAPSDSVAQDQLRVWMTVVRRRFPVKSQMPHFPFELFLKVKSFMRPLGSVILNPLYLAETATRKRQLDIEPLLGAALSNCFADLKKTTASGSVGWTRDAKKTVNGASVSVRISLGNRVFTLEGKRSQMWPMRSEDDIIDSPDWEFLRQKEIADKAPFVRLWQEEAKYANLMGILREFFESKGLEFTQNEEDCSKFEISWE
ncbi:unnamed protein product [Amoebophrya sp. A120]|nr:unnamed protein product [Amoebophrya sp. A120]|eukprot:GSA120T00012994001.1